MPSLAALISPIIHSPQLAEIAQLLQQTLDEERRMRRKFYADMTPELKIEFIDGEVVLHPPARNVHLDVTKWILKLMDTFVGMHRLGEVKSEKCSSNPSGRCGTRTSELNYGLPASGASLSPLLFSSGVRGSHFPLRQW